MELEKCVLRRLACCWMQVQLTEEEQDACAEVVEIPEAPGRCLDFLNGAIDACGHSVGDPVAEVVE